MKISINVQPAPADKPDGFEAPLVEGISGRTEYIVYSDKGGPNLRDPSKQDPAGILFVFAGKTFFVAVEEIAAQIIKGHQYANQTSVNNASGIHLAREERINS